MFIAVVLQKQGNIANALESSAGTYFGDTLEEAGQVGEAFAENCRKANSGYRYRTVVGEMTHSVQPPAANITLTPIKPPAATK